MAWLTSGGKGASWAARRGPKMKMARQTQRRAERGKRDMGRSSGAQTGRRPVQDSLRRGAVPGGLWFVGPGGVTWESPRGPPRVVGQAGGALRPRNAACVGLDRVVD